MPRATKISLHDIASLANLARATWCAVAGKRDRGDVQAFIRDLDHSLTQLSTDLLDGRAPSNHYRTFTIFDPKRRVIHAPVFRDRVVHHALMAYVGPELERRLVFDTYACRVGKGNLAAVQRAQQFARRHPWYGKLDVRRYFHSIHHQTLKHRLRRCIKGSALDICHRIIDGFEAAPGQGLPIGALSSQYFANHYLDIIDRLLGDTPGIHAMVRYMDDLVFWCGDKRTALRTVTAVTALARDVLRLDLHPGWVQRTTQGLSFLGFRIFPDRLLLSRRRQRRFRRARAQAERAYLFGHIDACHLQRDIGAALAITAHADSRRWRRQELARRPPPDA